jgi:hypothetical protein
MHTIITITDSVNRQPLAQLTRSDGTGYLTSPSLRELQLDARRRQARALGPTLTTWMPAPEGLAAPGNEYTAHWLDAHGWVSIAPSTNKMAELPDLGPSIEHPVLEAGPENDLPVIVGGNRSYRSGLYIEPLALARAGIYFHTGVLLVFRDGGSYAVKGELVWDRYRNVPAPSWSSPDGTRMPVQVVAAVETFDDPSRPQTGLGRPVIISQREPIVRHTDGRLQHIRSCAMGGYVGAVLHTLVDMSEAELMPRERDLLGLK